MELLRNLLQIICVCLFLKAGFCNAYESKKEAGFKGMFVFGSSVVDPGNNNDIKGTVAKANYLPYGIDFPDGSTGRFSNGKNIADCIADLLQLPSIPAFAHLQTHGERERIAHGVNFASGGSGILDETGQFLVT